MNVLRVALTGLVLIISISFFSGNIVWANYLENQYANLNEKFPWLFDQMTNSDIMVQPHISENKEQNTRPTFGLDHQSNQKIVDSGFRMNEKAFSIKDNFYTPFQEQTVNIGQSNSFEAIVYADKGLRVQEFLFGVPKVGDAHLAEAGVEIWFGYDGEIQQVKAVQKSNVIDEKSLAATHEKTKCLPYSTEEKCDLVKVSITFLEPLKNKVMALKAIDYKNRYQITYLNEGVYIAGESLNPMKTEMIPSEIKGEGLIKVTQVSKYSPYWTSEDGRMFERNSFGSFAQINYEFQRFADDGNPYTRSHSEFGKILDYEKNRATKIFDSKELTSDLPDSFAYNFKIKNRMSEELVQQMTLQEQIAKKIIEESSVQARW